jgi:hypothetical protein
VGKTVSEEHDANQKRWIKEKSNWTIIQNKTLAELERVALICRQCESKVEDLSQM